MQDPPDIHQVLKKLESKLPVCRVCLNLSMEYIEFESTLCLVEDTDITYFDAFQLVTASQVEIYDRLPKTLCSSCGNDLLNAFLFRKRVENADIILKKICSAEAVCRIQSLDTKVEKEHNEDQNSNLLHEGYPAIEKNFGDVSSKDHAVVHNEFTEIGKSWPSSPSSFIFVDSESETALKEPIELNESMEPIIWVCNDCGEVCTSEENLYSHCKNHTNSHYDERSFEEINDFKYHRNDISELESTESKNSEIVNVDHTKPTKDELYSCKQCNKKFHTKHLQRLHIFRYHRKEYTKPINSKESKVEKREQCSVCSKMVEKSFMEVHKEVHFGSRNSMCTECGKQFGSRLALRTHSLIHRQSGEFLCHICNKICLTKYALKSHIQFKHIADKSAIGRKRFKYQCEDCGLIFQYPSKLRVHQRKHNAETPYICTHCSRSYLRKDQFNIHMRYHNNDLPYKCDQCDKSYATKNNLSEHRKSVHDNVTYSCDKCEQKFKSVTGLRKHKFVHTGYPYVCPICGLGQSFRSGIKAHLLRVHKDTFTEEEFNETFPVVIPKSGFRRPKS